MAKHIGAPELTSTPEAGDDLVTDHEHLVLAANAPHRLKVARGRQYHPASALERLGDEGCHLRRASRSLDGVLELGREPLNKVGLAFALTPLAVV